jgi:hypothetical protein
VREKLFYEFFYTNFISIKIMLKSCKTFDKSRKTSSYSKEHFERYIDFYVGRLNCRRVFQYIEVMLLGQPMSLHQLE